MLPIPTPTARATFLGAALILVVGLALGSAETVALAGACFIGLATALAATMPLARRVRRQRLEFAWWLGHGDPTSGGGAVVPGAPFEVRAFVRHRGVRPILLRAMEPIAPGGTRVVDSDSRDLWLPAGARTEFSFTLIAPAAGRVVLHGLAVTLRGPLGLFEAPLYFPNPLAIKVLPRAAALSRGFARTMTGLPVERSGRALMKRHGGGTELRELRELQPGDPFKSIAWKASARAGKLLVREVEREVQETHYLVLDVSGTMRGGAPGSRKIDFAIEAAAAEASRAIAAGDRVGLVTVDGRTLSHVLPGEGRPHMMRIYDALLAAIEVVDEDLTEVDEAQLAGIVARYVRQQDGLDFSLQGRPGAWDVPSLVRHVSRELNASGARAETSRGDAARDLVVASSAASMQLRRFCRARNIPLPYRPDPRDGSKAPGIAAVLREAGARTRVPISFVVVTDLDGAADLSSIEAATALLRAHGHDLVFVWPDARSFADAPDDEVGRALAITYGHGESRRLREAQRALGKLGVAVVRATKGTRALMTLRPRRGKQLIA